MSYHLMFPLIFFFFLIYSNMFLHVSNLWATQDFKLNVSFLR